MKPFAACIFALLFLASAPALAEESPSSDFAEYGVNMGVNPFGGSFSFIYNSTPKTSWFATLGGLPSGEMDLDIEGTDYKVKSNSSWVGFFVNHRPIQKAQWFRVVGGIGFGRIQNELTDGSDNRFEANYTENPVGYLGIGFGARPVKGFTIGFDLGWLQTGGPTVSQVDGNPDAQAVEDISDHFFFGSALPNAQLTLGWGF